MPEEITVKKIQELKKQAQAEINHILEQFEKATSATVKSVNVYRVESSTYVYISLD